MRPPVRRRSTASSIPLAGGLLVYGVLKRLCGLRLSQEEEYYGADLSIHKIGAVSQD